ncbi:MAG: hypothetical protein EXR69_06665 [Myxococcales bacterium]|nr:hypothetical protein [Myxococcales bacterium]
MTELREQDAIESWLCTGLALSRVATPPAAVALIWFTTIMAERPGLPPPAVVLELATLAGNGPSSRLTIGPAGGGGDDNLHRVLRSWEDVLGRIAADRRLMAVQDAIQELPLGLRAEAAGLFASLVLKRICGTNPGGPDSPELAVVPAVVRRTLQHPAWRPATPEALGLLSCAYKALVMRARAVQDLIGPGDAFLLTWTGRLRSLEARVALSQLAEVADETELPRRVRTTRKWGAALTKLEQESAYPVGGFSAISTVGSIENLVSSELAYMSDEPGEVDLFDLRWAEGELLYYSRDEGDLHRERRAILISLDPNLEEERTPGPDGRQRIASVLGRLVAIIRRAAELLGGVDLHILLSAPKTASKTALPALGLELELLELLLLDLTRRQVLAIGRHTPAEQADWLLSHGAGGSAERVIVCAPSQSPALGRVPLREFTADDDPVQLLKDLL